MLVILVLLVIIGFLLIRGGSFIKQEAPPREEPQKFDADWNSFYNQVRVKNGTNINGKFFWINENKTFHFGSELFEIDQYDITLDGRMFMLRGGIYEWRDREWYEPDGTPHGGTHCIKSIVITDYFRDMLDAAEDKPNKK